MIAVNATNADTTFERLRLAGSSGSFAGYNVAVAIHVYGYLPGFLAGNQTLKNCVFEHVNGAYNPFAIADGKVQVSGNRFTDCVVGPYLEDFSNCVANVYGNTLRSDRGNGITVAKGTSSPPEKASTFTIRGNSIRLNADPEVGEGVLLLNVGGGPAKVVVEQNDFQVSGFADGVWMMDFSTDANMDARVTWNSFDLDVYGMGEPGSFYAGGVGSIGFQDTVVSNNRFVGSAMAGIYLGPWGQVMSGWLIKANNLNNLATEIAPVWLGPGTNHCTVIGANAAENVLDQGTDNVITGMRRTFGDPLGARLHDALEKMRQFKGMLNHRK